MRCDAEIGERLASALRVNDDRVEPAEHPAPQVALVRCAPRQEVVGGEDRWSAKPQVDVGLRERKPLHVHDVCAGERQRRDDRSVFHRLERQAKTRALEDSRRQRVEALLAAIALRGRDVPEPEPRGCKGHVRAVPSEGGSELVVVPGSERRRVGEEHAHGQ